MNFIFVSPHFPKTYWNFCDRLHRNGVNVLGIGDQPYDELSPQLKDSLNEERARFNATDKARTIASPNSPAR